MKRKGKYSLLLFSLSLLCITYLSPTLSESLRKMIVSYRSVTSTEISQKSLSLENRLLKKQNVHLRKQLLSMNRLDYLVEICKGLKKRCRENDRDFFLRRLKIAEETLDFEIHSIPARVIYRDPLKWGSTLWIDVGSDINVTLGRKVVALNSPVLQGSNIIGVVDLVGSRKSRVRLITDPTLVVAVRSVRGESATRELLSLVDSLLHQLDLKGIEHEAIPSLNRLKSELDQQGETFYLAKGELRGTTTSLWRSRSTRVKGVGFNYDFADEEGPARELRSGILFNALTSERGHLLIQKGDLLVTTGLDGLFPADLPVALVSGITPLKEGDITYAIEADLLAPRCDAIEVVEVLSPQVCDESEGFP